MASSKGRYFQGIRLRREDEQSPTVLETLTSTVLSVGSSVGCSVGIVSGTESLPSKDSVGYVGLTSTIEELKNEEVNSSSPQEEKIKNTVVYEDGPPNIPDTISTEQGFQPDTPPDIRPDTQPDTQPGDQEVSPEATLHALVMEAHSLVQEMVAQGLASNQQLREFVSRRYGRLTKFAMTREELEDLLRLLKLYGPAICSRVTGEFNPPTQIQLDFW